MDAELIDKLRRQALLDASPMVYGEPARQDDVYTVMTTQAVQVFARLVADECAKICVCWQPFSDSPKEFERVAVEIRRKFGLEIDADGNVMQRRLKPGFHDCTYENAPGVGFKVPDPAKP